MNESTVTMEWHYEDDDLTAMYASVKPDGEIFFGVIKDKLYHQVLMLLATPEKEH